MQFALISKNELYLNEMLMNAVNNIFFVYFQSKIKYGYNYGSYVTMTVQKVTQISNILVSYLFLT